MQRPRSHTASFLVSMIIVGVCATVVFLSDAPRAWAYPINSTGTPISSSASSGTSTGTGYDFQNSFQDLITPFSQFFDSLNWNTDISVGKSGDSFSVRPTTNINFDYQSYVIDFENWVYENTGINIAGPMNLVLNFFGWIFGLGDQAVHWLAGLFNRG